MPSFKPLFYFPLFFLLFTNCTKESISEPNPIVGEWTLHYGTGENGEKIMWKDLVDNYFDVFGTSCMEYTVSVTPTLVTIKKILVNFIEPKQCYLPIFYAYRWKKTNDTDQYEFKVGDNIALYTIQFYESDQRMEWTEEATNQVTVWIRE